MRLAKCVIEWTAQFIKKTCKIFLCISLGGIALIFSAMLSADDYNILSSILAFAAIIPVVVGFSELLRAPIDGPSSPTILVPALLIIGIATSLELVAIFTIVYAANLGASLRSNPTAAIFYSAQYFFNTGNIAKGLAHEGFIAANATPVATSLSGNSVRWINVVESAFGYTWLATYFGIAITVISKTEQPSSTSGLLHERRVRYSAAVKSLVCQVGVGTAGKSYNCQANSTHRITVGDICLKVRNGRSWDHYCTGCARTIIARDLAKLTALQGKMPTVET